MKLLVPAYGHPYESPGMWSGVVAAAPLIGSVIINPASGVGPDRNPVWTSTVARLRDAGVPMSGYVHSDWGRLDPAGLAEEVRHYQDWYGLTEIFVDCLPSEDLARVIETMSALRAAGATRIIGNSGTDTVAGVARAVDVIVDYERASIPAATRATHDGVLHCWIGHGLTWPQAAEMIRRADAAGVDWVWVTDGTGANPYLDLPTYWGEVLAALTPTDHS